MERWNLAAITIQPLLDINRYKYSYHYSYHHVIRKYKYGGILRDSDRLFCCRASFCPIDCIFVREYFRALHFVLALLTLEVAVAFSGCV